MKQVDTILLVKDIKESHKFYIENFGLEVLHDWDSMMIYKNRLALHQKDKIQPQEFASSLGAGDNSGSVIIYIELDRTESLEDKLDYLKNKGVEIIHDIFSLPWQRIFRVYDPDRNIIEIGEPSEET